MAKDSRAEIDEYLKKLEQNPESLVFLPLAEAYRKSGLYDEAIGTCLGGLAIHPTYMSAHVCIGRAYMEKKMLPEAAAEFKKVVEMEPNNILARGFLANIYMDQGDFQKVLEECERILSINPDNLNIQNLLAAVQRKLGIVPESSGPEKKDEKKDAPKKANKVPEVQVPQFTPKPIQLQETVKEKPAPIQESISQDFDTDNITGEDLLSVMKGLDGLIFDKDDAPQVVTPVPKNVPKEPSPERPAKEPEKAVVVEKKPEEKIEKKVEPKVEEKVVVETKVSSDPDLESILKELNKKSGILGSMVITMDGVIVANALVKGMDEKGAGSAGVQLFKKTSDASKSMLWGNVGLIIICAEASQIILVETKKGILNVLADINASFGMLKLALNETVKKING